MEKKHVPLKLVSFCISQFAIFQFMPCIGMLFCCIGFIFLMILLSFFSGSISFFSLLFCCPMVNFGSLLKTQLHSSNVNHCFQSLFDMQVTGSLVTKFLVLEIFLVSMIPLTISWSFFLVGFISFIISSFSSSFIRKLDVQLGSS